MSRNPIVARAALQVKGQAKKQQILDAAVALAAKVGYMRVTRHDIAEHIGCTPTLIPYHFGTMTSLRRDIMRAAVRQGVLPVIAQGLAAKDPHARRAPDAIKQAALATLAN